MTASVNQLICSFCARPSKQVKKLIKGPNANICDECVGLCLDALREAPSVVEKSEKVPETSPPRPTAIKQFLDRYVVGQEDAKIAMAVAVYDHYKRLANPIVDGVEIQKSNMLIVGPTGSGKTLLAETIARMLDVPFAIADATSLTEAGYVGDDVEMVIERLLQSAGGDVKKAERGIVYLDELDKKNSKASTSHVRDVSGEGAQHGLLKIIEGADLMVSANGKKGPAADLVRINTRNILFICGGAFVGLDKIVSESLENGAGIGFGAEVGRKTKTHGETMKHLRAEHLVKFGLIPELVGRLPVHVVLDEIDEDALVTILTQPENALVKQYRALFGLDGVDLTFEDEALRVIARDAIKRGTGARGLRGVIAKCLMPIQFQLPDLSDEGATSVVVRAVNQSAVPTVVYGDEAAPQQES